MCCSFECSAFYQDVLQQTPDDVAAAWLDYDHFESWIERAALMTGGGHGALIAERRALLAAWRSQGDLL